ncbi:HAD family hydrolase [Mangrovicella endophytica]|uniref:HAD family hydrolase n=1 Tax=Mangrovicella endophytica TaxID=2066697 RepID=UPI000C9E4FF9|nr:HAD family hydrolase [Mangrovicella endophytica]
MTIEAILFDMDGTLVDSNDHHVRAWDEAFRSAGYEFDAQTIHDQIGKGADMLVPTLLPGLDTPQREALGDAHGDVFKARYLNSVQPFAKARDLLEKAHGCGQRVVIASSSSQQEIDHYLDRLDAHSFVTAVTTKDDVESSKPAPDIFEAALKKLGSPAPDTVMVVGDTPYDIEAAARCGLRTVAVLSGGFSAESLRAAGAVALYADVAELLGAYETSPLGLRT